MNQILTTSIAVLLWRRFYKCYNSTEQIITYIFYNSQTYRLLNKFRKRIEICFKYSFLERITEIKQPNSAALDNSRTAKYLINFYKREKDKMIHYLRTSAALTLAKDTKEDLFRFLGRTVGIITITAVVINIVLCIISQKQIGLWGWLIRGLFLFAGVLGLFCRANWPIVKGSSIFLRKMQK